MMLFGSVGCCLGLVVSETGRTINASPEAIFLSSLSWTASHVLYHGALGACFSCWLVWFIGKRREIENRHSLRTILVSLASVAGFIVTIQYLLP